MVKYSVRFSYNLTDAFSTSGDVPRKRRRGILMVLPAFFKAMNIQKSASVSSRTFRLSFRSLPSFSSTERSGCLIILMPEETLHPLGHHYFTAIIMNGRIGQRGKEGNAVFRCPTSDTFQRPGICWYGSTFIPDGAFPPLPFH